MSSSADEVLMSSIARPSKKPVNGSRVYAASASLTEASVVSAPLGEAEGDFDGSVAVFVERCCECCTILLQCENVSHQVKLGKTITSDQFYRRVVNVALRVLKRHETVREHACDRELAVPHPGPIDANAGGSA